MLMIPFQKGKIKYVVTQISTLDLTPKMKQDKKKFKKRIIPIVLRFNNKKHSKISTITIHINTSNTKCTTHDATQKGKSI